MRMAIPPTPPIGRLCWEHRSSAVFSGGRAMNTRTISPVASAVLVVAVLTLTCATRGQSLNAAQATDLEKEFESAWIAGDSKALGSLLAENATIVQTYKDMPEPPDVNAASSNAALMGPSSKKTFLARVTGPGEGLKFETDNREIILREGSFVASVRAEVRLPSVRVCASVCFTVGAPDGLSYFDVTSVWAQRSGAWRVILLATYLSKLPEVIPSR